MAESLPIKFKTSEFRYLDLQQVDGKLQSELKSVTSRDGAELSLVFGTQDGSAVLEGALHVSGATPGPSSEVGRRNRKHARAAWRFALINRAAAARPHCVRALAPRR